MLRKSSLYGKVEDMLGNTQAIRAYFFKLGLSSEIADIYLALYAYGDQTISELARHSGVERTRIYRIKDELLASNLIEVESRYKRQIFRAAPISNLQILLTKKEQDLRELYKGFGDLQNSLSHHRQQSETTKIQAYRGIEGLKQMFWNQTRTTSGENLSILYENMQSRTKLAFFERWAEVMRERRIAARSIIGDNFVKTQKDWYKKNKNKRMSQWSGRYVPEGVFPITHSTVIYDDVTSYYNWKDGEIFGIEIYNAEIATAQRQFFEILWNQGIEIDDLVGPPERSL
ncbi:MAG TPA: helix-turn-helix domain-containing protein [Candidatus Saccharimonadales bacterium]|nr:helix-turn-helix domain-containing protein [Candidatus Saccharimonadales bacterium]